LRRLSLKTRVVLMVAAMVVAGIWVLALIVTLALRRDLIESESVNLSAEVGYVAADLDRNMQLHIDVLQRLAASLTPDIVADRAKLDAALDQFSDSSVIVPDTCFAANRDGIVIAGYPEHAVLLGASVAERGYFRELMASGKPVVGPALQAGTGPKSPAVPIAVPLRDASGAAAGALVGLVSLSAPMMFGRLEQTRLGRRGYFLVASPKDRMILSAPDPKRILQKLPPKGVIPQLDRRLEEGFEGAGITTTAAGIEQLGVGRKMTTTGWMVLAGVPTQEAFAPVNDFKHLVYLAAFLISLAVAAVLWFVLARQLAPLARAGRAMRRMTDGEVPMAPIPVGRQDETGELIGNFNRLVAERMRLEQSLRESRDRLEGIYLSVGDGIVSIDEAQRIVMFNAAAERMFGWRAAEMIGQPLNALLPERLRSAHEQQMRRFGATGQSNRLMGRYGLIYGLRAGGEEFPIEATVSQSGMPPNRLFTAILRDITERRKAEQARERLLEQLQLLSERLATAQEDERRKIAHELHEQLGQELATLQIYVQILGTPGGRPEADPHRDNALSVIAQAIERVRKLVEDLAPPDLEALGLCAAIRTHCQRQAAAGWTMHVELPEALGRPPRTVERACFHVLQEALSNVLRHANASEVRVRLRQSADELELAIRDDGAGFQIGAVREHGAGLGTFRMRRRVEQAGGRLEIRSSPGAGTEILAVFPLNAQAADAGG
jgi:PAS domain S-box-containing protein